MLRVCPTERSDARRGSVLLLVLWLMIGIGVVSLSYTASVRSQYQSAQAAQGRTQAYWAARAGVEKARVLLREADLETLAADSELFGDDENFKDQPVGAAKFSIYVPALKPGDTPTYGLIDEAARINLNTAPDDVIMKLPDATQDLRDALLDWRDSDGRLRPLGAELDYYRALERPTVPRDGPLYSLRELLRIRDWDALARQAYPDPFTRYAAKDEAGQTTPEEQEKARKLLALLTVWSRDARLAPDAQARMLINSATADTMRQRIKDLTEKEANAIVKHREGKQFESLVDLLEVKEPKASDGSGQQSKGSNAKNQSSSSDSSGDQKKMFELKRVGAIIDYFTIKEVPEEGESGLVNLNTAPNDVLALLPEMTDDLAAKVVTRRTREAFKNGGQIAEIEGLTDAIFKKIYPTVTARSQCFHAWVRGYEPDSGAAATIEAVLAVGEKDVTVVYWREN